MDFRFGPEEEALRREVRQFLVSLLAGRNDSRVSFVSLEEDEWEFELAFNRELIRRGWIAPAWPQEYGGRGATVFEQMVFNEEFGYAGAPDSGSRAFGIGMIGPTLIIHGTPEQKQTYLSGITSGRDLWCQGYSEPGAGSDLASLATSAYRDGDEYVLNGQKIWTSNGHHATHMFCLVRTDPDAPKHRGISFLLIEDLQHTPGLTIRPLVNMANGHHFNEVFFDNVRVPVANRVGEENRGWYVGMTLLSFERSGIGTTAQQKRTLEKLAAELGGRPEATRRRARVRLADLAVANAVARYLGYRIGAMQAAGQVPGHEASMVKVVQSELSQAIANFAVNLLGLTGQLLPGARAALPFGGVVPLQHLTSIPGTILSGTNEIQRNIIAERGLGLPRP